MLSTVFLIFIRFYFLVTEKVRTCLSGKAFEGEIKSNSYSFSDMTIAQIEAENTQLTNDLYRLLKKYSGLRNLIRELKVSKYLAKNQIYI